MHRMSNTSSIDLSVQVVVLYRAIRATTKHLQGGATCTACFQVAVYYGALLLPTLLLHTYYDSGICRVVDSFDHGNSAIPLLLEPQDTAG